jgi:uncharacterized protein YbjQ (UPF0145 family)
MRVTTLETVAGRSIEETLGYVRGSATLVRRMMKNKTVGLRALEYMTAADMEKGMVAIREEAEQKAIAEARIKGADAIIGLRVEIIDLGNATFQATASGTAVRTADVAAPAFEAPVFARPANDMGIVLPFAPRRAVDGLARAI